MIDLSNVDMKVIRKALEARGQVDRFITDSERIKLSDIIRDFDCSWYYDEPREAIEQMGQTMFGYDCMTDKELLIEAQEQLNNLDDIDEDSPSDEIFLANTVARYELEKVLEL